MRNNLFILLLSGVATASPMAANASDDVIVDHAPAVSGDSQSRVFGDAEVDIAAAGHAADQHSVTASGHGQSPSAEQDGHWGYSGDAGPARWGSMSADYDLCSAGRMQSPVDITEGLVADGPDITFNYAATGLTIGNNGHTVQVDYGEGSQIEIAGRRFDLLQLHFHTPSEHLIDGASFPMEMHLVHKDANGALAVVGVMFEAGASNLALSEIWHHLPQHPGAAEQVSGVVINARDFLPAGQGYHHYKGSLTTPPCTEGVNWFVLDQPLLADAGQVAQFVNIIGDNARPAQTTHNRLIISGN